MKAKEVFTKERLLGYGKNSVIGIQHVFAMMGATILVPTLANMSISMALLASGIGTLIFYFVTKRKVPVYLGSSFAFLGALTAAFNGQGDIGTETWNIAMGKVAVAIFLAGAVYLIFALIMKFVGYKIIKKLFPPVVVGPVIIVIGMCLAPTTFGNMAQATADHGAWAAWVPALLTLVTIVAVSAYARGFFKIIPILLGIIVGYIAAACFGTIDFTPVKEAGWVLFQPSELEKNFSFYKYLAFDFSVIMTFVPIAIVTFMEHLGDVNASSVVCGQDFFKDPGVHRTLMGDGLATMAASLIGGPCNTTYGENTAVLAITKNYNPRLIALAACFAVFLGIFSKVGGIIGTIPTSVIAGASMVLYGMIAANGLKTMVEARVDFSDTKNMIICSVILVVGIGMNAAGQSLVIGKIAFSPLAVATVVGIVLNLVLNVFVPGKKETVLSATYSDQVEGEEGARNSEEKVESTENCAEEREESEKAE